MVVFREEKKNAKEIEEISWNQLDHTAYEIGFAVDIGTTTIAMAGLDLRNKQVIGKNAQTNEQTTLGADVMMRIMHCMQGRGKRLHDLVVRQIERMAQELLLKYGQTVSQKNCLFFVVGNTTMCHLFLDKDVTGLAGYPFRPAYEGNYYCSGKEIGMQEFAQAQITVLSGIAAHVGSDALAVIGAEKLYQTDCIQLAVDLGTNAEIILNNKGKLYACSTAAGPAFEGKGIDCGMAAKEGAISGINLSVGNGNIILQVIEGAQARGICSSGLVDALAQFRKCRLMQEDGYLLSREEAQSIAICDALCERLVVRQNEHAFLLCKKEEAGREIYLRQSDIRNLQLAKGAIQAGMLSLLEATGLILESVDEFVVAGVLGSCVKPSNSIAIGLFPSMATDRLRFAGNAAGKGAIDGILCQGFPVDMEKKAQEITHIELAQQADFQEQLMRAMDFKPWLCYTKKKNI